LPLAFPSTIYQFTKLLEIDVAAGDDRSGKRQRTRALSNNTHLLREQIRIAWRVSMRLTTTAPSTTIFRRSHIRGRTDLLRAVAVYRGESLRADATSSCYVGQQNVDIRRIYQQHVEIAPILSTSIGQLTWLVVLFSQAAVVPVVAKGRGLILFRRGEAHAPL
jgi:hypothetical protein